MTTHTDHVSLASSELAETVSTLRWALDTIVRYERRLIQKGDPGSLVHHDINEAAKNKAQTMTENLNLKLLHSIGVQT